MYTLPSTVNSYYLLIFVFLFSFTTLVLILLYSFCSWVVSGKKNTACNRLYDTDPVSDAYKQALKIIEEARLKSIGLLKEAHMEKQAITTSSENVAKEIKALFENKARLLGRKQQKSLEVLSNEFLVQYKKVLENEKTETVRAIAEATDIIRQELLENVKVFSDKLNADSHVTQNVIQTKLQEEYDRAKEEIHENKARIISQMTLRVMDLTRLASHDVLGKVLTAEDHERVVSKALEKVLQNSEFTGA